MSGVERFSGRWWGGFVGGVLDFGLVCELWGRGVFIGSFLGFRGFGSFLAFFTLGFFGDLLLF